MASSILTHRLQFRCPDVLANKPHPRFLSKRCGLTAGVYGTSQRETSTKRRRRLNANLNNGQLWKHAMALFMQD